MRGFRRQVVGNCPVACEAAEACFVSGGDAVGAVITGFFAAAGAFPGVLLGPATVLLAEPGGSRVRAFDGRVRQPGGGPRRPRGWPPGVAVPTEARVGVAQAAAGVLLCGRYGPVFSPRRWLAPGLAAANEAGHVERARVLEAVSRLGAAALQRGGIANAMLHAAGPVAGGLLTQHDLDCVWTLDCEASCSASPGSAESHSAGAALYAQAPWNTLSESSPEHAGSLQSQALRQLALLATDAAGRVAGITFDCAEEGLLLSELQLLAPLLAFPPIRGEPRVPPGQPIPAPAPIHIELGHRGPVGVVAELAEGTLRLSSQSH